MRGSGFGPMFRLGRLGGFLLLFVPVNQAIGAPVKPVAKLAPVVEVMTIKAQPPVMDSILAVGTVRANEFVQLRPEIGGRVAVIAFKDGDTVRKGQLLLKLDNSVQQAEMASRQAAVALAEGEFKRYGALMENQQVSKAEYEKRQAELDQAKADLAVLKAKLEQYVIKAPFDGRVGLRLFSPGDFVQPGQALVSLTNLAQLKVDIRVAESSLGAVHIGQSVSLDFDAVPGLTIPGAIAAVEPTLDAGTRSMIVRIVARNTDARLKAGMTVRASLRRAPVPDPVVVPEQAVVPQGGRYVVFKVTGDKAVATPVQTGPRAPGKVTILKGVMIGDQIVVSGQNKLVKPEMPIVPVAYAGAL